MKKLILMRHAKSSWEYDVNDVERPLKKRGLKDTTLVARAFKKNVDLPEIIFSSPANRALTTCKVFMRETGLSETGLKVVDQLYDFGGNSVIGFLKSVPDEYNYIMIFGHNHAFTSIANMYGSTYIDNLPTAGLVVLSLKADSWKDIGKGTTEHLIFPKDLR